MLRGGILRLLRGVAFHAGLILVAAACCVFVFGARGMSLPDRLGWLFLCLYLGGLMAVRGWRPRRPAEHADAEPEDVRIPAVGEDFDEPAVRIASDILLFPQRYTDRIVHEIEPGDGYIRNVISRELAFAREDVRRTIYFPVLRWRRGSLIDNLDTRSSDNRRVRILPSRQAQTLTFQILSSLTFEPYKAASADVPDDLRALVKDSWAVIASDRTRRLAGDHADRLHALLEVLDREAATYEALLVIRDLWDALAESFLVFAVLEADPQLPNRSITVSYTHPLQTDLGVARAHSFWLRVKLKSRYWLDKDNLRYLVGLRPFVLRWLLLYGNETPSYHLRFNSDENDYIFDTSARRLRMAGRPPTPKDTVLTRAVPASSAVSYTHLYFRPYEPRAGSPQAAPAERLFMAEIDVREKPPGSLGVVALIALVQLVLIAFVTLAFGRVFGGSDGAVDVPALILALPGLLLAVFAQSLSTRRLVRAPFAAIVGIAANIVISVVSVFLAIVAAHGWGIKPFHWRGIAIYHPEWRLLMALALWNVLNLAVRSFSNIRRFVDRRRKRLELVHEAI